MATINFRLCKVIANSRWFSVGITTRLLTTMAKAASILNHPQYPLRQIPSLSRRAVAIVDIELCAVGSVSVGDIEAATGLRIDKAALVSPAPFLRAGPVAVKKLDDSAIDGSAVGHVHALAEHSQCSVAAVLGPALRVGKVAGKDLDLVAVSGRGTGVIDTLTGDAADRASAAISGFAGLTKCDTRSTTWGCTRWSSNLVSE